MKNFFKYNLICVLGAGLCVAATSCKKILEPEAIGSSTIDVLYSNYTGAHAGVNSIYAALNNTNNLYKGRVSFLQIDKASDDLMDDPFGVNGASDFDFFTVATNNEAILDIWRDFYTVIYRANIAIDRIPGITFAPREERNVQTGGLFKDQYIGEAKFLRAFAYFNLVRTFGAVPMHLKEVKTPSEVNIPRSSVAEVYAQIEADLTDAVNKLPASGFRRANSVFTLGNEAGRVTKWSALAMLADVYLTQKKYDLAKSTALQVINNNGFAFGVTTPLQLMPDYSQNFPAILSGRPTGVPVGTENNDESLFEIQFSNHDQGRDASPAPATSSNYSIQMGPMNVFSNNNGMLQRFRPTDVTSPGRGSGLLSGLVQQYESGDRRLAVNFNTLGLFEGQAMRLTNKYYDNRANNSNTNFPIYRMAEMYLIHAEASNELAGPDAAAVESVNKIRRRAFGLNINAVSALRDIPLAGLTQESFRELIRLERRRELAVENKRWFDLVRYGYDYAYDALVTKQDRKNFNQNKMLFPLPELELRNNPLLGPNNPGY
jgi:hypothetical protein